jgi:hypothetical protein
MLSPAEDRDWWRAFVGTVMNLRGSIKDREFLDKLSKNLARVPPLVACPRHVIHS